MRRFLQQHGRNEKPQVWEIFCGKNSVYTEWGQLGGAMQRTVQKFEGVNIGKANEKKPDQVAQEFMDRTIKKKMREGYFEVNPETNKPLAEISSGVIDFDKPMPQNLRFYKPLNSLSAGLSKKIAQGKAIALRKRNGYAHPIVQGTHGLTMYGANMLASHKDEPGIPWLDRYPKITQDLAALNIPPKSILLGELVTVSTGGFKDADGYDVDDFNYVGSIVKSKSDLALFKQDELGHLGYCIWDIAFWRGEDWLKTKTPRARQSFISDLLINQETWAYPYLRSAEMNQTSDIWTEEALTLYAKEKKWEGWVIIDPEGNYGDKSYNFHGKAERPAAVGKLKPTLEVDVVVWWNPDHDQGAYGKGKKSGGVGSVAAYLWDDGKQEFVYINDVGGGLTDEQVQEFADVNRYPRVWQVEFANWTPKGAMFHPVFVREREDKEPVECEITQRPELTEEE